MYYVQALEVVCGPPIFLIVLKALLFLAALPAEGMRYVPLLGWAILGKPEGQIPIWLESKLDCQQKSAGWLLHFSVAVLFQHLFTYLMITHSLELLCLFKHVVSIL